MKKYEEMENDAPDACDTSDAPETITISNKKE